MFPVDTLTATCQLVASVEVRRDLNRCRVLSEFGSERFPCTPRHDLRPMFTMGSSSTAPLPVSAAIDRSVITTGVEARCTYVETYWLGQLGPSCVRAARPLVAWLEAEPAGFEAHWRRWRRAPSRVRHRPSRTRRAHAGLVSCPSTSRTSTTHSPYAEGFRRSRPRQNRAATGSPGSTHARAPPYSRRHDPPDLIHNPLHHRSARNVCTQVCTYEMESDRVTAQTITIAGARGGSGTTTVAAATALLLGGHAATELVAAERDATAALLGLTGTLDGCAPLEVVERLTWSLGALRSPSWTHCASTSSTPSPTVCSSSRCMAPAISACARSPR